MRRLALRTGRPAALAALVFVLAVSTAAAAEFLSGDAVRVDAGETVSGDLYVTGRSVVINGTVEGDLVAAAMTIEINGDVLGSVEVAGMTVSLGGSVDGSVRAAAADVTVSGEVGGDLVAASGSVNIDEDARVLGDVGGGVGNARINGTVSGDVLVGADELAITGTVRGDLDVDVDRLEVASSAVIGGDLRYTSQRDAEIDAAASLGGVVQRTEPSAEGPPSYLPDHPLVTFVGLVLGLLLLGWLMLLVRPVATVDVGEELRERPLLALGTGLAGWIAQFLLLIGLLLISTLLSQLAGAIGGAVFFVSVIFALVILLVALVAQVYVALGIGDVVARAANVSPRLTYVIGVVVVAAVLTLAGTLHTGLFLFAYLALWILGLGSFVLYQARRRTVERELVVASGGGTAAIGLSLFRPSASTPAPAPAAPVASRATPSPARRSATAAQPRATATTPRATATTPRPTSSRRQVMPEPEPPAAAPPEPRQRSPRRTPPESSP